MKKLILSVTAIAGLAMGSFAQGVIYFDGSNNTSTDPTATSEGRVFLNGVLDTGTDINASLLYSATPGGTFLPVVNLSLASSASPTSSPLGQTGAAAGDITFYGSGQLLDNSGTAYIIPGIAAGGTAYFEVTGGAVVGGKTYTGSTAVFSEVLASATGQANDIQGMGALNLTANIIPEPTSLAMAGLGIASMLVFRRRNK